MSTTNRPLMMSLWNYKQKYGLTEEDEKALKMFIEHRHEFHLDQAPKYDPYDEAKRFNKKYFNGTQYAVHVAESCCFCTDTGLYKIIE